MPGKKRKKPLCRQQKELRDSQPILPPLLRLHFTGALVNNFVFHKRDINGMLYMNCALWLIVQNVEHSLGLCLLSLYSDASEPFISMLRAEGKADGPSQSTHSHSKLHLLIHKCSEKKNFTSPGESCCEEAFCTTLWDLMKSNAPLLSVHRRADRCLVTCVGMFRFRYRIVLSLIGFQGGSMCASLCDDIIGTECKSDRYVQMYVFAFMLWACMLCRTLNGRFFHAQPFFF